MYESLCLYVMTLDPMWLLRCEWVSVCVRVCVRLCICSCICPGHARWQADCKPGLWTHRRPPIITFTKSSLNVCFNLEATGQQTIRITEKETFQSEAKKNNLETDKWSSLLGAMASVTAASLQSCVIILPFPAADALPGRESAPHL